MSAWRRCADWCTRALAPLRSGMALAPLLLAVVALGAATPAWAHKSSDAYLKLSIGDAGLALRVDVALRDLDAVLDLDADGDGKLVWSEVRAAWPAIEGYVQSHLQVAGCNLQVGQRTLEKRADGVYAVLSFTSPCKPAQAPAVRYTLLGDVDPTHRGLARIDMPGAPAQLRVLDPLRPAVIAAAADTPSTASAAEAGASGTASASASEPAASPRGAAADAVPSVAPLAPAAPATSRAPTAAPDPTPAAASADSGSAPQFLREGFIHILGGYDHVLFLLCLLLPAVVKRTPAGWKPVDDLGQAVWPLLGIISTFTVAHSITLALASLKLVSLPPFIIDPLVALTIVLAAVDNLWPILRLPRPAVTFFFGLIHGFGFAGVLAELDLPAGAFAWALLQFNLGLELGQLCIVGATLGALYVLRSQRGYVRWAVHGGSLGAAALGMMWFFQRLMTLPMLAR